MEREAYIATHENSHVVIKSRFDGRYYIAYFINGKAFRADFENSLSSAKKSVSDWFCVDQDTIEWKPYNA